MAGVGAVAVAGPAGAVAARAIFGWDSRRGWRRFGSGRRGGPGLVAQLSSGRGKFRSVTGESVLGS